MLRLEDIQLVVRRPDPIVVKKIVLYLRGLRGVVVEVIELIRPVDLAALQVGDLHPLGGLHVRDLEAFRELPDLQAKARLQGR